MVAHTIFVSASILCADFARLTEEIAALEDAGIDSIHFDIMDGHFVPNLTFGPMLIEAVRPLTRLPLYAHLMVENPSNYLLDCKRSGADGVIVHPEAEVHLHRTISHIRELGMSAGAALNPATPLSAVEEIIENLDILLIMSVNPGFAGQEFIPSSLKKIRRARDLTMAAGKITIAVDGGINPKTAPLVVGSGANCLVAASAIFGDKNYRRAVENLRGINS